MSRIDVEHELIFSACPFPVSGLDGYKTKVQSSWMERNPGGVAAAVDIPGIVLTLHSAGLAQWVQTRLYDAFWMAARTALTSKPDAEMTPANVTTIRITDGSQTVHITMPPGSDFEKTRLEVKTRVSADGGSSAHISIGGVEP